MPVIVNERDQGTWLDPKNANTEALQQMLVPYPAEEIRAYPVSTRVSNSKNEGPD